MKGGTRSKPMSQIGYKDTRKKRGSGGGVDPPASWKTSSKNFNLISPQSDISAPSRIAFRQRHPEPRRRLSQQVAPPTIQEESREDTAGNRRNARYRGRPSTESSKRRSHSAPPSRPQTFKEQSRRAKEVFMGCMEESAHKMETMKDEALVPAARKVKKEALVPAAKKIKSGLNVTGKATKRYSKAAVKNLRERHIMKKVKNFPSKTVGSCAAGRSRHVESFGEDHMNERSRGLYNDDERMLRYSSDSAEEKRDVQLQMDQEHYRNMQKCTRMMEQAAVSVKPHQKLHKAKSHDSQNRGQEPSLSQVASNDCSSLHMLHLEDEAVAELALHHEDSYFTRLAGANDSPPLNQNAIGGHNAYYVSSPESHSSPVASLFTSGSADNKNQEPRLTKNEHTLPAASKQKNDKVTSGSVKSSQPSSKPRNQHIHRSRSNDAVERSLVSRQRDSKKGPVFDKQEVRKTRSHDHAKSRKPNMRVATESAYKVDNTWLKLTPDGESIVMSSKAVTAKSSRPKASPSSVDTSESVLEIVQNETAPSVLEETNGAISHNLSIRQTESAPSGIETQRPKNVKEFNSKPSEQQVRQTEKSNSKRKEKPFSQQKDRLSSKSGKAVLNAPSQKPRHEEKYGVHHPATRQQKDTFHEEGRDTTDRPMANTPKEKNVPPPQASKYTNALAIYSPTQDSLLDGSVTCPPVSDQALSNAAFLFSPSYAHGTVNISHPPSLTRESHFAITTSASRSRLTNMSSRTRPTFSIPAKTSNDSGSASASVTKTYSYQESKTQAGGLLRRTSHGSSKKQVRFSDVSETSSKKLSDHPSDVDLPAVESKMSDLSDSTRHTTGSADSKSASPLGDNVPGPDEEKSPSSSRTTISGWRYREAADGKLSSATPVIGKNNGAKNPTSSPMKRFYAAKSKFANPPAKHTPAKKTPPKKFARRSPKHGLVSSRITELDVRITNTGQSISKNVRRETGGHGVIAPRPATLKNPLFAVNRDIVEDANHRPFDEMKEPVEKAESESNVEEIAEISPTSHASSTASTEEASDIFNRLRTSNENQEEAQESEDDEESVLSDYAQELFDQILSKPSIDVSEAPSVSALRRRFSSADESTARTVPTLTQSGGRPSGVEMQESDDSDDHSIADETFISEKETESVSTYSRSISYAPSFGSYAPVNPREQRQHHLHATPENLCLSPVQRTPMQARKWRTLAAEAKERDLAKKGAGKFGSKQQKSRKAFKERSLNVF